MRKWGWNGQRKIIIAIWRNELKRNIKNIKGISSHSEYFALLIHTWNEKYTDTRMSALAHIRRCTHTTINQSTSLLLYSIRSVAWRLAIVIQCSDVWQILSFHSKHSKVLPNYDDWTCAEFSGRPKLLYFPIHFTAYMRQLQPIPMKSTFNRNKVNC